MPVWAGVFLGDLTYCWTLVPRAKAEHISASRFRQPRPQIARCEGMAEGWQKILYVVCHTLGCVALAP